MYVWVKAMRLEKELAMRVKTEVLIKRDRVIKCTE